MKKILKNTTIVISVFAIFNNTCIFEVNAEQKPIRMNVGYVEKTNDSIPPELHYTKLSDSMASDFISLYNNNELGKIYKKSDANLKNKISYKNFQKAIKDLKSIFGNITHFQRITREEQLASSLISMCSETNRKTPNGELCDLYLYRIKCEKLQHDGMLELVYTKQNNLIDFYIRSELIDIADKITKVENP